MTASDKSKSHELSYKKSANFHASKAVIMTRIEWSLSADWAPKYSIREFALFSFYISDLN